MFDHKNNSPEPGQGDINLLPKEMQKDFTVKGKKTEPPAVHRPKEEKHALAPKAVLPKPTQPAPWAKPSFFSHFKKLFGSDQSSHSPSIVTVSPGIQPKPSVPPPIRPAPLASVVPPVKPVANRPVAPPIQTKRISSEEVIKNDLGVNLLPPTKKHLTDSQIIFSYFFILIICLLVIFTPYIYYKGKNKGYAASSSIFASQLALADSRITEMQSRIKDYAELSLQLKNLNTVFTSHIYWSRFFPTLEQHTASNVYFRSLSVSDDGQVSLEGAGKDLRSVAEELVVMNNSQVYTNFQLQSLNFVEAQEPGDPTITFGFGFDVPMSIVTPLKAELPATQK